MSGIMAILSLDGRPIPPELPRAQLAAIAHRGEWEPRLWEAPGIALGHVNLPRTPEAEREFLPGSDRSGRYWITWDGRLDNRDELAGKLGYDVSERAEHTDADYVLEAFIKWGEDCVHRLLGDWAVVIWDNEARRLFCAKDPLGWRQLYYAEHEGLLAVGSEPQQFFADGWLPKSANENYLLRLLGWAMQDLGATCWSGVRELVGGSRCTAAAAEPPNLEQFFTVPRPTDVKIRNAEDAAEAFVHTFRLAADSRTRSNRPLGIMLSGGLDSSYITAVVSGLGHDVVPVIGYSESFPEMDEREFSSRVTAHLGLTPLMVSLDDCWPLHPKWMPRTPVGEPFQPPQGSILSKLATSAATEGIGVLLSGEGGDEWMTGGMPIGADRCIADAIMRGKPSLARRIVTNSTSRDLAPGLARACFRELLPVNVQTAIRRTRGIETWSGYPKFVTPGPEWNSLLDPPRSTLWRSSNSTRFTWDAMRDAVSRETIAWRDRNVFAKNQIENRSPFNDMRVVNLMAAIPESLKRHSGRPKAILRDGLRAVLPAEVAERTGKAAMNPLFDYGLANAERERAELGIRSIEIPGFDPVSAMSDWNDWLERQYGGSQLLWTLASVGIWFRESLAPTADPAEVVTVVGRR